MSSGALQQQIAPLVGATHDYSALGRGLPRGKNTRCTLLRARASTVALAAAADGGSSDAEAIRIELVGDRFLRRMVRTLVSTAVWAAQREHEDQLASPSSDGSLLLRMATSGEQEQTAHPAPARGLVFAGAGGEGDVW